ncbi:MAG: 50S ribosomal protein L32 [Deferribacteraceae bacterium]|jgi:large subunit ribosomal protein L32|nr:50S ribosomal protein L32 [Deferribacteraceae bacterium]
MGNPKHKVTKSKQSARRSHRTAKSLASGKCKNCGAVKQSHTVCPVCGYYDQKEYIKQSDL